MFNIFAFVVNFNFVLNPFCDCLILNGPDKPQKIFFFHWKAQSFNLMKHQKLISVIFPHF